MVTFLSQYTVYKFWNVQTLLIQPEIQESKFLRLKLYEKGTFAILYDCVAVEAKCMCKLNLRLILHCQQTQGCHFNYESEILCQLQVQYK